ncbi:hypothetical protein ZIOFF_026438 [Zingiber officinale]|uniref:HAT C-terminal dimerisation domain-containing protein n=1 Tax=Zingiber officinale TaxID=94328 RepID=A0A8J5GXR1_ZINOF|nr:hypothetical protein ZIOFF_026438 [Zingiber officinale]
MGDYFSCVIDVESRDSRDSDGSTASPSPLLEDQAQLLLLSLLVPTASSTLPVSRTPGGSAASPSVGRSSTTFFALTALAKVHTEALFTQCTFAWKNLRLASEATFSAGGRVIDKYRASLAPTTV